MALGQRQGAVGRDSSRGCFSLCIRAMRVLETATASDYTRTAKFNNIR